MSTKEMSLEVKAVAILRDSLEKAVIELNELLQEQIPVAFREKPVSEVRKAEEKEGGEGEIGADESAKSVDKVLIPDFDPADLMRHDWKGKKISKGEYENGSLSWGWDYKDNFKPETIKVLENGKVLTIGNSEFILLEKIVQTKKIEDG